MLRHTAVSVMMSAQFACYVISYLSAPSADGAPPVGPLPQGELSALEANTPARGLQVTVLEPQLTVLAGHGDLKVSLQRLSL